MRKFLAWFVMLSALCLGGLGVFMLNTAPARPSATAINEAVMAAMDATGEGDYRGALDVLLVSLSGELDHINQAAHNRNRRILLVVGGYQALFIFAFILLQRYYKKRIIDPFVRLQDFAKNIARGDLDAPLYMDKSHAFGAFTESFDLLREELKMARENAREADRRKKELVASLSHDIKTPVAAIKATAELMQIRDYDDKTKHQLQGIFNKAEEVTVLVNDMFHSTLEELQALKVTVAEFPSTALGQLIQNADYKNMVTAPLDIPDCVLLGDTQRIGQVVDNIIGNAYKYANSPMDVSADFDGGALVVTFRDYGAGVEPEELSLLFNKFYRGRGTAAVSGYGLGLYIAKYLLEAMGGGIRLSNMDKGFAVQVTLMLA